MNERLESQKALLKKCLAPFGKESIDVYIDRLQDCEAIIESVAFKAFYPVYKLLPHETWMMYKAMEVKFTTELVMIRPLAKGLAALIKAMAKYESEPTESEVSVEQPV